ncbi:hypothetical protein KDU71_14550 [Carboxylicivirga sediminis]|uniref:Uncharacterized protein n=1 Tax=Carboxylicivirga sediminis TaxID=2006564 RepID=A0A941IXH3_9BACT|nr:hypothetical protein [Carboxylicivirga sediminis]MBR8536791.1 hypothetical protein [Carboxylicivirga sediminis]
MPEAYKQRLKELREKAKTNVEHGTIFYTNGTRDDRVGSPNGGTVDLSWKRYKTVDMVVHNHTKRASVGSDQPLSISCFSATDIGALHKMITEPETKLSPNFIFMVIHDEATYIVQIDDLSKFIESDFYNMRFDFIKMQEQRLQSDVEEHERFGSNFEPPIDEFSREGFVGLFAQYGISLLRSTNNRDFTEEDKWHHITIEQPNPRDNRNLINPCKK